MCGCGTISISVWSQIPGNERRFEGRSHYARGHELTESVTTFTLSRTPPTVPAASRSILGGICVLPRFRQLLATFWLNTYGRRALSLLSTPGSATLSRISFMTWRSGQTADCFRRSLKRICSLYSNTFSALFTRVIDDNRAIQILAYAWIRAFAHALWYVALNVS